MRTETNNSWALTAPGIHGERVPMRDLSREEVDFCVVGAGLQLVCAIIGVAVAEYVRVNH